MTELRFTWPEFAATGLAIASISYVTWFRFYRGSQASDPARQTTQPSKKNQDTNP